VNCDSSRVDDGASNIVSEEGYPKVPMDGPAGKWGERVQLLILLFTCSKLPRLLFDVNEG